MTFKDKLRKQWADSAKEISIAWDDMQKAIAQDKARATQRAPRKPKPQVIAAPFSFAGSTKRILDVSENGLYRWLIAPWLLLSAWTFVICWYGTFGICVIPFRLLRRGHRKQVRQQQQHDELVATLLANQHEFREAQIKFRIENESKVG